MSRDGLPARELWALSSDRVHLNHGSYGGVPIAAFVEQRRLLEEQNDSPNLWFAGLPDRVRAATDDLADFLGLPPGATALTTNASAAATVTFRALLAPSSAAGRVLVNDHNYGAVVGSIRHRAAGSGINVQTLAIPLTATDAEIVALYADALAGGDVVLLLVDQISSSTARAFPVDALIRLAHVHGARIVVDGSHAPGILARPLPADPPDVWFGNLHKHLCSPQSGAVLVASEEVSRGIWPVIDSWNADLPYPQRFDVQGSLDVTGMLSAPIAARWIEAALGWDRVRAYASALTTAGAGLVGGAIAERFGTDPVVGMPSPAPHFELLRLPAWPDGRDWGPELRGLLSEEARIQAMVVSWGGELFLRLVSHAYTIADDYTQLVERGLPLLEAHLRRATG